MKTLLVSLMQQTTVSYHVRIFSWFHAQFDSFVFVKVYSNVSITLTTICTKTGTISYSSQ